MLAVQSVQGNEAQCLWEEIMGEAHCKKISLGLLVNVLPFKLCFVDQSILEDMFKGDISWKTLLSLLL